MLCRSDLCLCGDFLRLGFFCLGFCSGNKGLYLAAITEYLIEKYN